VLFTVRDMDTGTQIEHPFGWIAFVGSMRQFVGQQIDCYPVKGSPGLWRSNMQGLNWYFDQHWLVLVEQEG